MIIAPTTKLEAIRDLAIAAASQASEGVAELLRYAREGDGSMNSPFGIDCVEQLLDAAKMAMEIEGWPTGCGYEPETRVERRRTYDAISKYLEGWA